MDLLSLMFGAPNRGVLAFADGLPWSDQKIAGAVGGDVAGNLELLNELLSNGVAHRNGRGAIFSRRMTLDQKEREQAATRQNRLREKGGGDPDRWTAIRIPILERDGYCCAYCGKQANTVDHVIPKSNGGTEDSANLVACCKSCNNKKSNRTPEQAGMTFCKVRDISITQKITPTVTPLSGDGTGTVIDQKQKIPLRFDSTEVAQSLCSAEGLSGPVVIQALRETIEFVANRKKSEDYTEIGSQILGAWDAHQREKGKFAGSLLGFLGGGAYKPYLSEETAVVPARYASLQTVIAEAKRDLGKD